MREKLGQRVFKNSVLFFILIYSIELIARFNVGSSFADWAVFRIAISSILISIFLSLIVSFLNKITYKIAGTILSIGLTVYLWVEVNLYNYMGFFMGVGNANQGEAVTSYISEFLKSAKWVTYLVLVPLTLYLVYIWWLNDKLKINKLNKTTRFIFKKDTLLHKILTILVLVIIIVVLNVVYYFSLTLKFMQNELQSVKNTELIISSDYSNLSVSQFGVFVYGGSDLFCQTFGIEATDSYEAGDNSNSNDNKTITDYTRIIDDTAWNSIIDNETDSTDNKLNNYFINRDISDKNDYTGIFQGKNLIVILMESVDMIAINEKEYPTLYKIYNEGISFTNNYTPRNNCSTGNNEMTVMTSLYTINNTCTYNTYKNNTYFEAIFNMFNNEGYTTSSYHDYNQTYYYRNIVHPNMGSMAYYDANDLGIWSGVARDWPSDVDLISSSIDNYINEDNFMVFYTTVTTHQQYTISSKYGDEYVDDFADYDYSTAVKRYMSKLKVLDQALKTLMDDLEAAGKLDDTVIALFSDHYPYGLTTSQINSVLDYDVTVNNEVDRTPMVIYNSATAAQKVTKYTTIIDLLPTLLNMFGVDYDPRYYFGTDVFSDSNDGRAIFADGSWQDDVGYYSATTGKFTPKDESNTYTNEELIEINNNITTMQKMSALAIKNDYFNYLSDAFKEYYSTHQTTTTTTTTTTAVSEGE